MKFFLGSADVTEVRKALELGLLDGVTTNPSLVAKTGKPVSDVISAIAEVCEGPISCEVIGTTFDAILREARAIRRLGANVVVKVPLIPDGLRAVKACSSEGIKTNVTLCFNAVQALLAAKAGATYISPFVGRLDDIGHSGMEVIEEIRTIYDNYDFATQILVASIRSPLHLRDAALVGADVATLPFDVLVKLSAHPLTDLGLAKFLEDAKRIPTPS